MLSPPSSEDSARAQPPSLRGLCMFTTGLSSVGDETELVRLVATALPSLIPSCVGGVALQSREKPGWSLTFQIGGKVPSPQETQLLLEALAPALEKAIRPGRLQGDTPDQDDPVRSLPLSLHQAGVVALDLDPIRTLSEDYGVLMTGGRSEAGLDAESRFIHQTLASQVAVMIENLRLQRALTKHSEVLAEKVRKRTEELSTLLSINRAVSFHRRRDDLFPAIVEALESVMTCDRMMVAIVRAEEDDMYVYALAGGENTVTPTGTSFPIDQSAPGWVVRHQQPFIGSTLADMERFPESYRSLKGLGIHSNCVLPLRVGQRAIGALILQSSEPGHYDSLDLEEAGEMADAIAIGLDNCLAYEEISRLKDRLALENVYLQEEIKMPHAFDHLVGESRAMRKVLAAIEQVAATDATVLITGETGTGKGLVAEAIHELSAYKGRPLVKVNCAALPSTLIESELFGHERGAFTGAAARKIGRFELADGGTIFLDEIGDLALDLQVKLLRVLQDGEFERVGGSKTLRVQARVIAATNRDLTRAVREEKFRSDLFYRLNVYPVEMPPLRDRAGDVRLLAKHFVRKIEAKLGKQIETIPRHALDSLEAHDWPGNVRELENIIERAMIVSQGPELHIGNWLPSPEGEGLVAAFETLEQSQRRHILGALEKTDWVVSGERGAAKLLGLKATTLEGRMKKLGILHPRRRGRPAGR